MAQPQRQDDVHQDELCPSNKRYALMDANKKIDLDNLLCLNKNRILANILHNHPVRSSIVASSLVPWIYLGQFWHTLKEDNSKYMLKFMLDRKELTLNLDDFRIIFQLPQATNNNHKHFVVARKFSKIVPITLLTRTSINTDSLSHIHKPYRKHKDEVGMKILSWMITDGMKLTENYQMYAAVFGVDVPTTQSQPIESSQRMHRTISAPRSPNLETDEVELKPMSNKKSLEVEITAAEQPVNVIEEEEKSAEDDYELKRREKGKHEEESFFDEFQRRYGYLFEHLKTRFLLRKKFNMLAQHLQEIMEESLPTMVDDRVEELTKTQVPDDPHDDAHRKGENSAKRQNTFEHGTFVFRESSIGQDFESKPDNDEIPTEKVSQEPVDEMSHTVNEVKLHKVVDEMLRQRCTLGDEHQYHIDHMQNFLKNDIVWESKKRNLSLITSIKPHSSRTKLPKRSQSSCTISVIFPGDDIEERTSRWVEKVLEGLKSYNNDVKHGYVTPSLSNEDVEYLQLFEGEIKERLEHHDQMRRWEIYVNERSLRSRRERPE
uniref:Uncharacterized protein n=1 Tax=Tanacetum cinerariifolium TaxID=118510 RepID=A0A699I4J5_TANCI|nr:hypothetical protein [Tanacetum cinerariifolium]